MTRGERNKQLIRQYRAGDRDALNLLVSENEPLVVATVAKVAKKWRIPPSDDRFQDMLQEGRKGILRAVEDYDDQYGGFPNYAYHWIYAMARSWVKEYRGVIRLPSVIRTAELVKQARKAERCYSGQLGDVVDVVRHNSPTYDSVAELDAKEEHECRRQVVIHLSQQLPHKQREAVLSILGVSTAEMPSVSYKATCSLRNHAIHKLRRLVAGVAS